MPGGANGPLPVPADARRGPGKRTRPERGGPCGPDGGPVRPAPGAGDGRRSTARSTPRRWPPTAPASRRAGRCRSASWRACSARPPPLGAQPDGRSPAEPGTGLAPAGTATQGAGTRRRMTPAGIPGRCRGQQPWRKARREAATLADTAIWQLRISDLRGIHFDRTCPAQRLALGTSNLAELNPTTSSDDVSYRSWSAHVNSPVGSHQTLLGRTVTIREVSRRWPC